MQCLKLRKIPQFHLISWCGNFAETHSFRIVSGESPKISTSGNQVRNLSAPSKRNVFKKFAGTNKAEGIVVKPMRNIVARNKNEEKERVIVKIVLPAFVERHHSARHKVTKKGN